jgi:hypothetical protein
MRFFCTLACGLSVESDERYLPAYDDPHDVISKLSFPSHTS